MVRLKPLCEQVMVITGASSGIGLATAREAARRGTKVVLVARNEPALQEEVDRIRAAGGEAMHVPADVSQREELVEVAQKTIEHFGRFDTWVNNAGLSIWGRLMDVSEQDLRRLFDINFWGLVNGSLIAVDHLRRQGGAIINLGSVASDMALPLQGMYSASKHAVKGFTDALRMELEQERLPISVTLIKPTSINTPFPQHARNYTDREAKLPPPVYAPEEVAHAILHAATRRLRDVYVGGSGKLMSSLDKHAHRLVDWMGERVLGNQQQRDERPRKPDGALYRAGDDGHVHGDHPGHVARYSWYTRTSLCPAMPWMGVAAGLAAVALVGHKMAHLED